MGLRLHICTNEPEICGFMTNEYKAGKMSIMKCDQCKDGYLIVKSGKGDNCFLGCTNYKKDGTGCGKYIAQKQYYEMFNLGLDVAPPVKTAKREVVKISASQIVKTQVQKSSAVNIVKASVADVMYLNNSLNEVVFTILQCLSHVSEKKYYGVTMLVDILRGANSQKIVVANLNSLPEYGKLKGISRDDLITIIEWLIENHYILKTRHPQYPVLHPTYEGMHYSETITVGKLNKLLNTLLN